jgi:hypothetical protein
LHLGSINFLGLITRKRALPSGSALLQRMGKLAVLFTHGRHKGKHRVGLFRDSTSGDSYPD